MKKGLCILLFLFFFNSSYALHCPLGNHGNRFFSAKLSKNAVTCYYDHQLQTIIQGFFKPLKPWYWYIDLDDDLMCLGVRNCQFVYKQS